MNERRSSWASDGGCWTCSKDFPSEIKAVRDVNVTVSRETGRRRRSDRPNTLWIKRREITKNLQ